MWPSGLTSCLQRFDMARSHGEPIRCAPTLAARRVHSARRTRCHGVRGPHAARHIRETHPTGKADSRALKLASRSGDRYRRRFPRLVMSNAALSINPHPAGVGCRTYPLTRLRSRHVPARPSAARTSRSTSDRMIAVCAVSVWSACRPTASRAINIIDMTSSPEVVRLASPSGLRFEDDPKARAGRLSEALQRIGRGSYFATFDTSDVGL